MEDMDTGNMDDLVNQAEKLTAEISGETLPFPRVERNLKQLAEAGNQLWSRTTQLRSGQDGSQASSDIRASVLLGSKGFDLQKVSQNLDSLASGSRSFFGQTTAKDGTRPEHMAQDIQSFLKLERETAILSVIEEVKESTMKKTDELYWNNLKSDWEEMKLNILNTKMISSDPSDVIDSRSFLSTPQMVTQPRTSDDDVLNRAFDLMQKGHSLEPLLGFISPDGCRIPGEIDQDRNHHQVDTVIEKLAIESEKQGFLEEAIKLYDLCGQHNQALNLLNRLLGTVVTEKRIEGSKRDRLEGLALKLAER